MNIRLAIDQLVIEGMPLSRGDRVELEESLRDSLTLALSERAVQYTLPERRSARREQMQVSLSGNTGGAELGKSFGASLGSHIWDFQVSQSDGQREKQ